MTEPKVRMDEDSYLAFDRKAERKHEMWDGEVYAMPGASFAHNVIVANLIRHLANALDDSRCEPLPSGMRLRVPPAERYVYPDVTIVCDPLVEGESDILINPITIFEVLSASSAGFDRGDKFAGYRTIPGLEHVVFVSQDQQIVECYTRQDDDSWLLRDSREGGALTLRCLPAPLAMNLIYEDVELTPERTDRGRV